MTDRKLIVHLVRFRSALLHEPTLRRLHEVISAQSRAYMALEELVTAWVPSAAAGPTLVKRLMTGLGTLPNVKMTYRLMELGTLVTGDARAGAFFAGKLTRDTSRQYEKALTRARRRARTPSGTPASGAASESRRRTKCGGRWPVAGTGSRFGGAGSPSRSCAMPCSGCWRCAISAVT